LTGYTMRKTALLLSRLRDDKRAVTALEYGIIVGWLALTIVGIFVRMGNTISSLFGPEIAGL